MQKTIKSFDGVKINYSIDRKSDKFLIFLHGAGGDLNAWEEYVKFFNEKGFSTLAVDIRGHGFSKPLSESDYYIENCAKDIAEIIKNEKIENFIIVGHCFGGMVALTFSKMYSNQAAGYVFIDFGYQIPLAKKFLIKKFISYFSSWKIPSKSVSKIAGGHGNYDASFSKGDLISFRRLGNDLKNTGLKPLLFIYKSMFGFNGESYLKLIKEPVIIIHGEKDVFFNVKFAKKMNDLIEDSKLILLNKANHWPIFNKTQEINSFVYDFLKTKINW